MKKIFHSLLISIIALITLSSCYAMSDDGVMSSIDYNVIISNGYPHYRNGRVIYYYYNNDYYYPHYYNGHRYFRREDITDRFHLLGDIDLHIQDLIGFLITDRNIIGISETVKGDLT